MAPKPNHSKEAISEARKAGLDVASILIPDLGKARDIVGSIDHTGNALHHGREAIKEALNRKTRKLKNILSGANPKKRTSTSLKRKTNSPTRSTSKSKVSFLSHGKRVSFTARSPSKRRR